MNTITYSVNLETEIVTVTAIVEDGKACGASSPKTFVVGIRRFTPRSMWGRSPIRGGHPRRGATQSKGSGKSKSPTR